MQQQQQQQKNSFTESLQFKGEHLALQSDFFEYKGHSRYWVEFFKKKGRTRNQRAG